MARFARLVAAADEPDATAALLAEVRQMEDRLGLSPVSLLRLRWQIDAAPRPDAAPAGVTAIDRYRTSLDQYRDL